MQKELYNFQKVEAYLQSQKEKEQVRKSMLQQQQEERVKAAIQKEKTGDPFRDFTLELSMVQSAEASKYIKFGREKSLDFIDLLYRKDWIQDKKVHGVKLSYIPERLTDPAVYLRVEAKFEKVTVADLVDYFTDVSKRMQWDGANFESMQEVRVFPMKTSLTYIKLKQASMDALMLSHRIELVGNRVYLVSGSVVHGSYVPLPGTKRIDSPFSFNYFEPTDDETGVRNIYICQTTTKALQQQLQNPSRAGSIKKLQDLLAKRDAPEFNNAYLPKADQSDEAVPELTASIKPAE